MTWLNQIQDAQERFQAAYQCGGSSGFGCCDSHHRCSVDLVERSNSVQIDAGGDGCGQLMPPNTSDGCVAAAGGGNARSNRKQSPSSSTSEQPTLSSSPRSQRLFRSSPVYPTPLFPVNQTNGGGGMARGGGCSGHGPLNVSKSADPRLPSDSSRTTTTTTALEIGSGGSGSLLAIQSDGGGGATTLSLSPPGGAVGANRPRTRSVYSERPNLLRTIREKSLTIDGVYL